VNPSALQHLHLTWQGLADGSTRTWLGFPQLGSPPWFAVIQLDDARLSGSTVDLNDPAVNASRRHQHHHEPDHHEPDHHGLSFPGPDRIDPSPTQPIRRR
jgi:hypothetical protein